METYSKTPGTAGTGELAQNPDPTQTKAAGATAAIEGQGNNQQGDYTPTTVPLPEPAAATIARPARAPTPRTIKAAIDPFAFYAREIEHAPTLKVNDKGWSQLFPCPLHTDHDGSFAVSARTGAYHCFGCGAQGGSVIDFAMAYDRLDLDQARAALSERYGVQCEPSPAKSRSRATEPTAPAPESTPAVLAPIPAEALAMRPTTAGKLGEPSATWEYRDADGRPVAYVLRFDRPEGGKEFRPQTWDGTRWNWKAPAVPPPALPSGPAGGPARCPGAGLRGRKGRRCRSRVDA
ncbi:CHC2 zinc finger domain-containing protein [uncultured Thiodictyon sp.]|uniref:CHC2 zinc finger domain-containing protein n=1 Tax=uncultured Thiodictyon sp. TaxID=1846217 RepID=UPI0025E73211|nr:CHC2 zinc finger domain-containing protein [uncultured Thiodictyon sp.]